VLMLSYDDSGNKRKQPATLRHEDRENKQHRQVKTAE